jgi:hypothetical protein
VVDVVELMKASAYDRTLIALTLLAPLLLFALSKWRASLDTLYAPAGVSDGWTAHVSDWLASRKEIGSRLIVVVDRDCPCTTASLGSLHQALAQTGRTDIQLSVRYVDDPGEDARWAAVVAELPSTPTLLAIEGRQLAYAGPVTSGNLCTTAVQRVLGVTALQAPRDRPILNWLDSGCYCRQRRAARP